MLATAQAPTRQASLPSVEGSTEQQLANARFQVQRGELAAAEAILRKLLSKPEAPPETQYLLGYVLFRNQRFTDSLAAYTSGALLRSPSPGDLIVVASDYIGLRAYADAERWLLRATQQDGANAQAWYLLGRTQYNLDHADDALASFERCLRLKPRDLRAEYNRGLALERLSRTDDAIAAYRTAIGWETEEQTRDPQPYLDLGMLLLRQRRFQEALPPLQEAVDRNRNNPLAQQELGLALEGLGRLTEALTPLQRSAELAPEADQAHFFLGRIYRRLGRKADADAQFAVVDRLAASHSDVATPNRDRQP